MSTTDLRSDLAEARQLIAQAVELAAPVLEEIELAGGTSTAREARRLNELITEAHEGLTELEEQI